MPDAESDLSPVLSDESPSGTASSGEVSGTSSPRSGTSSSWDDGVPPPGTVEGTGTTQGASRSRRTSSAGARGTTEYGSTTDAVAAGAARTGRRTPEADRYPPHTGRRTTETVAPGVTDTERRPPEADRRTPVIERRVTAAGRVTDLRLTGAGDELVTHLAVVFADPMEVSASPAEIPPLPAPGSSAAPGPSAVRGSSVAGGHAAATGSVTPGAPATGEAALLALFEAQVASRWLDVAARRLRGAGRAVSGIASAGHECDAALALALRPDDPVLPHYRSRAFLLARAAQAGRPRPAFDAALAMVGSAEDPSSGGRRQGGTDPTLAVFPYPATPGGTLPRALGIAWSVGRARQVPKRLRTPSPWPRDAVVVAGFGDGTASHTVTMGTVAAARRAAEQGLDLPLLLVCEDNGLAHSARTPTGWVRSLFGAGTALASGTALPSGTAPGSGTGLGAGTALGSGAAAGSASGLDYRYVDGSDPLATLAVTREAVEQVRAGRRPMVLHLGCVRIGGHTAEDDETRYRTPDEIAEDLARDPLAATARAVVEAGLLSAGDLAERVEEIRQQVTRAVAEALARPLPGSAEDLAAPLALPSPDAVADRLGALASAAVEPRRRVFGKHLPEEEGPLTLAETLNRALLDAGAADPRLVVLGEDVARLGGEFGVTRGIQRRLGASRIVDGALDDAARLGLGLGAASSGLLPVVEFRSLVGLRDAATQLVNEAAGLAFATGGVLVNPLVLRVSAFGGFPEPTPAAQSDGDPDSSGSSGPLGATAATGVTEAARATGETGASAGVSGSGARRAREGLPPEAQSRRGQSREDRSAHSRGAREALSREALVSRLPRPDVPVPDDAGLALFRDVPGLLLGCPSHPCEAAAMLRTCLAAADRHGTVSVLLEPIGLYHERDMLTPGDGAWLAPYAPPALWGMAHVPIGHATVWGTGTDLTVATYGAGVRRSLRAAARLSATGVGVRVVDLRWLAPLPVADVVREATRTGRLLVVDEVRRGAGVAEVLITAVLEAGFTGRLARLAPRDGLVAAGEAARWGLVTEEDIEVTAGKLMT